MKWHPASLHTLGNRNISCSTRDRALDSITEQIFTVFILKVFHCPLSLPSWPLKRFSWLLPMQLLVGRAEVIHGLAPGGPPHGYTKGEAVTDLARFLEFCGKEVDVLAKCEENNMSHGPVRDQEQDRDKDVFYSNQFISVVMQAGLQNNLNISEISTGWLWT